MVVYLEYAFMENFLLDGALLYLALKCAHCRAGPLRLIFAAAAGGGEALIFPILTLPVPCAYLVKLLGGALLVLIALPAKKGIKTYLFAGGAFFGLTFLLGGVLTALYSFFGVPYIDGGYLVESAPVGLVLACAVLFVIVVLRAARALYRYRGLRQNLAACRLKAGGKSIRQTALADTGNRLFFRGRPVCVVSALAALALFGNSPPLGRMTVVTVNGTRISPVFPAEYLEVELNGKTYRYPDPLFTVGDVPAKEYQMILHTAYLENCHEDLSRSESLAQ